MKWFLPKYTTYPPPWYLPQRTVPLCVLWWSVPEVQSSVTSFPKPDTLCVYDLKRAVYVNTLRIIHTWIHLDITTDCLSLSYLPPLAHVPSLISLSNVPVEHPSLVILLRAMLRDPTLCCRSLAHKKAFVPLMPLIEVCIYVPASIIFLKAPLPTRMSVLPGCI